MRTAQQTAVLVALLFKRSGERRARVSEKTIRRLAKRSHLRTVFLKQLLDHTDDLGLTMTELPRGGYGILPSSALEGAKPITAKKYLADDLKDLERRKVDFEKLAAELEGEQTAEESDDDE
jgi:hypothetical protein